LSISTRVDVNTVVGDPVETPDGTVIIPISRVTCGFAAGINDTALHHWAKPFLYQLSKSGIL
jgi:uncharacterized spore protein YtfJ